MGIPVDRDGSMVWYGTGRDGSQTCRRNKGLLTNPNKLTQAEPNIGCSSTQSCIFILLLLLIIGHPPRETKHSPPSPPPPVSLRREERNHVPLTVRKQIVPDNDDNDTDNDDEDGDRAG